MYILLILNKSIILTAKKEKVEKTYNQLLFLDPQITEITGKTAIQNSDKQANIEISLPRKEATGVTIWWEN